MSAPYQPSFIAKQWYRFKSYKFPWRRHFFRGFDLDGNRFYESYNPLTPKKLRRTVKYMKDGHYTDNNVTPQWMQWLRHTRKEAPTLAELQQEVLRIQGTRRNAELISQRWEEERTRLSISDPQDQAKSMEDLDNQLASIKEKKQEDVVKSQEERQAKIKEARIQEQFAQGDREGYIPAPGTRDGKGEWQPEPWNPAGKKPLRR